ncbi:hypothetical protein HPJ98_13650 [Anoxybacillus flavithermus]|nr:hypothetical protein [Anoxybacillus flavithermus]MBE2957841.1 hypothetical protein [Anoxybacillus flavithermus]
MWHIYFNQGIGFMSSFLFGCKFMLVNLLIYSYKDKVIWGLTAKIVYHFTRLIQTMEGEYA